MINSFKTLSAFLFFSLFVSFGFAQEDVNVATQIVGEWDVVLESPSKKFSQEDLDYTKKRDKESSGNSNIAVYTFGKDGKFKVLSIKDYSQSDEKGTYAVNEDGDGFTRSVQYPNHLKEKKRTKVQSIKSDVLYIDDSFLVLRSGRSTYYLRRMR